MPQRFCIHYVSKSGKANSGNRKTSILMPIPKNVLAMGQLHSSPMLVRSCLKYCMLGFSIDKPRTSRRPRFKKGRGTRDQIANICWIIEKAREFQKKHLSLFNRLSLWLCGSWQIVGSSKRDGNTRPSYLSSEKPVCCQEATLRTLYGTPDWFKTKKGVG